MKLVTNTIGTIENPSVEDIRRSFHDDMEDVAGNLYALYKENGDSIHSISGHMLQKFSLSISDPNAKTKTVSRGLRRDSVEEYFVCFYLGDDSWKSELQWE